jgi:hypothetical protein
MMKVYLVRTSAIGAILFGAVFAAHATTLYNNLPATSNGSSIVINVGPLADSFSTGGSSVVLNSVTLDLLAGTPSDGGSLTVTLKSDNGTSPGSTLETIGTLQDSALTTSLADYSLTTDFALSASTRYWIELSSANPASSAAWSWSNDISGPGVAGEYYMIAGGIHSNTGGPYQMDVEASGGSPSPVPEPSTLLLLGSGLMTLAAPLRRRLFAGHRG